MQNHQEDMPESVPRDISSLRQGWDEVAEEEGTQDVTMSLIPLPKHYASSTLS